MAFRTITPDELDGVLKQAAEEGWRELAIVAKRLFDAGAAGLGSEFADYPDGRALVVQHEIGEIHHADMLKSITDVTTLRRLKVSGFAIGDDGAAQLKKINCLVTLCLNGTEIGVDGAAHLANLTELRSLNLYSNEIGDEGARHLAKITNLTSLDLSLNAIGDEGAMHLANLTGLTRLVLFMNKIGDEGARHLASLTCLKSLNLNDNQIGAEGAACLGRLDGLTSLDLQGNRIDDEGAAHLANLTCLTSLNLHSNRIGDKGVAHLSTLTGLKVLGLVGNPIYGVPQEILESRDAQAIFRHILQAEETDAKPLHEVRIVVLGEGGAGKSHVRARLTEEYEDGIYYHHPHHVQTHDIEMREFTLSAAPTPGGTPADILARAWDFGGQPHLHASHRFFLSSERNIYLVVLDAQRSLEDNRLRYWLRLIHDEAPGAPIVVLVTKCDASDLTDAASLDEEAIHQLLPPADDEASHSIALVTGYGWSPDADKRRHAEAHRRLLQALTEAVPRVRGVGMRFPPGFFETRRWLEGALADGQTDPVVTCSDYEAAAGERGLGGENAPLIPRYLAVYRNLGVCHWVGDRPDVRGRHELDSLIFDPTWVKRWIYTLIRAGVGDHDRGVMTQAQVEAKLPAGSVTPEQRRRILDLMRACGLCFDLPDDEHGYRILLPDLLPTRGRDMWASFEEGAAGRGTLRVDFLRDDVLLRFLGEWYDQVTDPPTRLWRDEVTVTDGDCSAVIQADIENATIHAHVTGGDRTGRDRMAGKVERTFETIFGDREASVSWNWEPADHPGESSQPDAPTRYKTLAGIVVGLGAAAATILSDFEDVAEAFLSIMMVLALIVVVAVLWDVMLNKNPGTERGIGLRLSMFAKFFIFLVAIACLVFVMVGLSIQAVFGVSPVVTP